LVPAYEYFMDIRGIWQQSLGENFGVKGWLSKQKMYNSTLFEASSIVVKEEEKTRCLCVESKRCIEQFGLKVPTEEATS
jgi:hypothetical protein